MAAGCTMANVITVGSLILDIWHMDTYKLLQVIAVPRALLQLWIELQSFWIAARSFMNSGL